MVLAPAMTRVTDARSVQVLLIDLHRVLGNQWHKIAEQMPERSEQHLKNLFTTRRKAKTCGHEFLLHAYVHETPVHTLSGLCLPLVVGTMPSTRSPRDQDEWCLDVQLWQRLASEGQMHVYLADTPHPR